MPCCVRVRLDTHIDLKPRPKTYVQLPDYVYENSNYQHLAYLHIALSDNRLTNASSYFFVCCFKNHHFYSQKFLFNAWSSLKSKGLSYLCIPGIIKFDHFYKDGITVEGICPKCINPIFHCNYFDDVDDIIISLSEYWPVSINLSLQTLRQ